MTRYQTTPRTIVKCSSFITNNRALPKQASSLVISTRLYGSSHPSSQITPSPDRSTQLPTIQAYTAYAAYKHTKSSHDTAPSAARPAPRGAPMQHSIARRHAQLTVSRVAKDDRLRLLRRPCSRVRKQRERACFAMSGYALEPRRYVAVSALTYWCV